MGVRFTVSSSYHRDDEEGEEEDMTGVKGSCRRVSSSCLSSHDPSSVSLQWWTRDPSSFKESGVNDGVSWQEGADLTNYH